MTDQNLIDERSPVIASTNNNRAMKLGLAGRISCDDWVAVRKRYGNRCAVCGSDGPLTMDHIMPLSKGGQHSIDNIQPLCKSCNSRKSNHWAEAGQR